MNKQKLIKLRCKAWGITEDEYYCNQCSDFSLEDMARAYRRGKNKGFEKVKELEAQIEQMKCCGNCKYYQFQNDARYYTCIKDGKRNGKYYRSCEFNLEKWEGR